MFGRDEEAQSGGTKMASRQGCCRGRPRWSYAVLWQYCTPYPPRYSTYRVCQMCVFVLFGLSFSPVLLATMGQFLTANATRVRVVGVKQVMMFTQRVMSEYTVWFFVFLIVTATWAIMSLMIAAMLARFKAVSLAEGLRLMEERAQVSGSAA